MKEYIEEFDGVTYKFSENDLSNPFLSFLKELKEDILEAKKRMGTRYTDEIDSKVNSLLDTYIITSFEFQLAIQDNILRWSKDVTPQNAMHYANTIGSMARGYDRAGRVYRMILLINLMSLEFQYANKLLGKSFRLSGGMLVKSR